MTIQIVAGYYAHKRVYLYRGSASETAIKRRLTIERSRSSSHWAYLRINHRRVDDDQIEKRLARSR